MWQLSVIGRWGAILGAVVRWVVIASRMGGAKKTRCNAGVGAEVIWIW